MSIKEIENEMFEIDLGISKQAVDAMTFLENGDPQAFRTVKNYFSDLIKNLKVFDITDREVTYDQIFEKIQQMLSLRNEVIKVVNCIARYKEDLKFYEEIHLFFENLLPYFKFRNDNDSNNRFAADHYEAFGTELFLYTVASLLKYSKFEQINVLTQQGYYIPRSKNGMPDEIFSFTKFCSFPEALSGYYKNLNIRQEYQKSKRLKESIFEGEFTYEDLAQADFVLHLISLLDNTENDYFSDLWSNQVYLETHPLDLFVRAEFVWFFEKLSKCLRGISRKELTDFINQYNQKYMERSVHFGRISLERKIALSKIATREYLYKSVSKNIE